MGEFITAHWAQIALILTLGLQAFTVWVNVRAKRREQKFDTYIKAKVNQFIVMYEGFAKMVSILVKPIGIIGRKSPIDIESFEELADQTSRNWLHETMKLKLYLSDKEAAVLNALQVDAMEMLGASLAVAQIAAHIQNGVKISEEESNKKIATSNDAGRKASNKADELLMLVRKEILGYKPKKPILQPTT